MGDKPLKGDTEVHPQLGQIIGEFESALARVQDLAKRFGESDWVRRPSPDSWSAAECVAHLNITSEAYLRTLPPAVEEARAVSGSPPTRFRLDPMGWLIAQTSGRRRRFAVKTPSAFEPVSVPSRDELIAAFERLQREQIEVVRSADGLPIHRVRIASPFASRVRYSLYSALALLPEHQHRHIHQAERSLEAASPGAALPS